jgi:hypothetical protein
MGQGFPLGKSLNVDLDTHVRDNFDPPIYFLKIWKNEIKKMCTCCSTIEVYVLNYWYFYLLTIISYKILKEKNALYNWNLIFHLLYTL